MECPQEMSFLSLSVVFSSKLTSYPYNPCVLCYSQLVSHVGDQLANSYMKYKAVKLLGFHSFTCYGFVNFIVHLFEGAKRWSQRAFQETT